MAVNTCIDLEGSVAEKGDKKMWSIVLCLEVMNNPGVCRMKKKSIKVVTFSETLVKA